MPPRKSSSSPRKRPAKSPARRASRSSTKRPARSPATTLLLRDLDPEVLRVLQARAERSGRSLQQELHLALRRDARRNFDEARALAAAWQQRLAGRTLPDSTDLLRDDRSR